MNHIQLAQAAKLHMNWFAIRVLVGKFCCLSKSSRFSVRHVWRRRPDQVSVDVHNVRRLAFDGMLQDQVCEIPASTLRNESHLTILVELTRWSANICPELLLVLFMLRRPFSPSVIGSTSPT